MLEKNWNWCFVTALHFLIVIVSPSFYDIDIFISSYCFFFLIERAHRPQRIRWATAKSDLRVKEDSNIKATDRPLGKGKCSK